jgi:hypothetical protein
MWTSKGGRESEENGRNANNKDGLDERGISFADASRIKEGKVGL